MRFEGFNRLLFHPGQRVGCALSGGADSTALLLALLEANQEKEALGVVLSAIHIHHGLRGPEADADEAFVLDLCARLSIPLTVTHVDTAARQQAEREGLEEAARELRYAAFRHHLAAGHADVIATAHTLDDQAETVLMKLLRGAWTEGLSGIAPILPLTSDNPPTSNVPRSTFPVSRTTDIAPRTTSHVLRPMLATSRAEIERFLRERKQSWREDSTNRDTRFTRNRLRHEILPLLRSVNPALDEALARTAEIARDEESYWQAETDRLLPGLLLPGKPVRGGGRAVSTAVGERSLALELDRLRAFPPALNRRLLRAAAATLGCRPGADDTGKLLALAGLAELSGFQPRNGSRLDLGNGLRAERSLRELRLSRSAPAPIPKKM